MTAGPLTPELMAALVSLGGRIDVGDVVDFDATAFPSSITRLHWSTWQEAAKLLSDGDLAKCIKAMTLLEGQPGYSAGSVSAVIWLFRILESRVPNGVDELAAWVLATTTNDYAPFGTPHLGARSVAEFRERRAEADSQKRARRAEVLLANEAATQTKAALAGHKLFGALRRRDLKAIDALVQQGADLEARSAEGLTVREYAQQLGLTHLLNQTAPD